MTLLPKPCACGAPLIGLSDGSSVHGWRCSQCGHEWPRHVTVRGMARFNYVKSGGGLVQEQDARAARWTQDEMDRADREAAAIVEALKDKWD